MTTFAAALWLTLCIAWLILGIGAGWFSIPVSLAATAITGAAFVMEARRIIR